MSKDLNKVQAKVFSSEFKSFCKKQFSKDMKELEEERKKALLQVCFIILGVSVVFALIAFIVLKYINNDSINAVLAVYLFILTASFIPIHKYKQNSKKTIMPKLLAFVGDFQFVYSNEKKQMLYNYIKSLELFEKHNYIDIDDMLEGTYNNINVSISEICLKEEYRDSNNEKRETVVFDGVLLSFKSFKNFKSKTIIKSEHIKLFKNRKQVLLEDPEFEKIYDVESGDQIEARYLITPAFMNRMVEYSKSNNAGKITVSFENANVNIAVHSTKNWFDVPILKPATDVSIYTGILLDLILILKIIDALKMDQNIGM